MYRRGPPKEGRILFTRGSKTTVFQLETAPNLTSPEVVAGSCIQMNGGGVNVSKGGYTYQFLLIIWACVRKKIAIYDDDDDDDDDGFKNSVYQEKISSSAPSFQKPLGPCLLG